MKRKSGEQPLLVRVGHISETGEPWAVELSEVQLAEILEQADGGYATAGEGAKARFELHRTGENVFIRGDVQTTVAMRCCRCLADLTRELQVHIKWSFLPLTQYRSSVTSEEELELTADDLDVSFYDGEEIDLGQVIREALLLELDPYPACATDCDGRGLEAELGEEARIDPRWLPLLELKRKQRS